MPKVQGFYAVKDWWVTGLTAKKSEETKDQCLKVLQKVDPKLKDSTDEQWFYEFMENIKLPKGWILDFAGTDDALVLYYKAGLGKKEVKRFFSKKTKVSTMSVD